MTSALSHIAEEETPLHADLRATRVDEKRWRKQKQKYYGWRGVQPSMVGQSVYTLEFEAGSTTIQNTESNPQAIEDVLKLAGLLDVPILWPGVETHLIHAAVKSLSHHDSLPLSSEQSIHVPGLIPYLISTHPNALAISPTAPTMTLNLTIRTWTKQDNFLASSTNIWPLDVRHSRPRHVREHGSHRAEQKRLFRNMKSRTSLHQFNDFDERYSLHMLDCFEREENQWWHRTCHPYSNPWWRDLHINLESWNRIHGPRRHATSFRGVQMYHDNPDKETEDDWNYNTCGFTLARHFSKLRKEEEAQTPGLTVHDTDSDVARQNNGVEVGDANEEVVNANNQYRDCWACKFYESCSSRHQRLVLTCEASLWGIDPQSVGPLWWGGPFAVERSVDPRDEAWLWEGQTGETGQVERQVQPTQLGSSTETWPCLSGFARDPDWQNVAWEWRCNAAGGLPEKDTDTDTGTEWDVISRISRLSRSSSFSFVNL